MTIPVSISTALSSLQSQVIAAEPLTSASEATRTAIKLNAQNLVNSIQSTLKSASVLDTWAAPSDAISIVSGFLTVVTAAEDQSTLALMRGICGRSELNLDQLP